MTTHNETVDAYMRDHVLHTIDSLFWTVEADDTDIMLHTDSCTQVDPYGAVELAAALIAAAALSDAETEAEAAFEMADEKARRFLQDIRDKRHINVDELLDDDQED